jgi:hypothetical protein
MDAAATVCSHCGYEFPPHDPDPRRGIAYSRLADMALFVGSLVAGLGSIGAIFTTIFAIINGEWLMAGQAPIAFFLCLAMLVVFIRVQRL